MDVILINPPHFFEEENRQVKGRRKGLTLYPPLGITYLASCLEKKGIKVMIIDVLAENMSTAEIIKIVERESPKIIGITSTTPQIRGTVQLAKCIRKNFQKNIVIALGGAHVSADPDFIKRFKLFDFAVVGEGEITFTEKVLKVLNGKNINGVFTGKETVVLDDVPLPARHLLNLNNYYMVPYGYRFATIHTARGCPFNCSFCSKPESRQSIRYRTPENVLAEIDHVIDKYNAQFILFTDDTFTMNKRHAEEICNGILRRKFNIEWSCETRANLINESIISLMAKSGCKEIDFGVESGNENIRNHVVNKGIKNEEIISAFKLCKKFRIQTGAFCMLGLPSETKENMYETYRFCRKLMPDTVGFHLTVPLPGSAIYVQALKEGKISKDYWDGYAQGLIKKQAIYLPDGFSIEDIEAIQKVLYRKYYLQPKYLLHRLLLDITSFKRLKHEIGIGTRLILRGKTITGRP